MANATPLRAYDLTATVRRNTLSDGSHTFDVLVSDGSRSVTFYAYDERRALNFVEGLRELVDQNTGDVLETW